MNVTRPHRWLTLLSTLALAVLGLCVLPQAIPPAEAHQASAPPPVAGKLPSSVPSAITPNVNNGSVWSAAQVGNLMVIGGDFSQVGGQTRNSLAAFNTTTGALSPIAPNFNGMVYSVLPGPNDHTAYVGGAFTQVNGSAAQFVTLLDLTTGSVVSSFKAPAFNYGLVRDMAKVGNRLYVGGFFATAGGKAHGGIAALNATTGALDPFMNVQFAGHHNDSGSGAQGYIGPWALDVSPDGSRMAVIGNFKTADGQTRDQLAMIDIDGTSAVVDPNWATQRYAPYCFNWAFDGYVRGVTFSPDGSYFIVNATGGGVPGTLCDATSRFETDATGTDIQPTWVDETGGDTVWGVTVTQDAIYIGGHNRWNNNPNGVDQARPGAVPRPGMAALDPASGRPYTWNPGHNPLGKAVYALLATSDGLWMGSNFDYIGNYKYVRQKIAFFPYAGGTSVASTTVDKLPGTVYLGEQTSNGASNVLYRVDAGGPEIESSDGGPNWETDTADSPSDYQNHQSNAADWDPVPQVDSSVPSTTPSAIFDHERWSPTDNPPMSWDFPIAAGTDVEVRLYFANRCTCTSAPGSRVFDVDIDGRTVLDNYDIVAAVGDQVGTMKSFDVTVPHNGRLDVDFTHVTENPLVDGIEIINKDVAAPPPPSSSLEAVGFDGTTAQSPQATSAPSTPWGATRGAFMVGDRLYYGNSDGYLYRAIVDGSSFGTPEKVDPYHDPAWDDVDTHDGTTFEGSSPPLYSQLPNVTGMFYAAGRLYFTIAGDAALHWAWFSPDSGIVDGSEFTATSSVNFSKADGMFISDNTLYFVKKSDESLYSVPFEDGVVSGVPVLVNGPSTGGVDWTNRSLFFVGSTSAPANEAPSARFSSSCSAGGCAFDASGSSDSDGSIASYHWDFGDGEEGDGISPSHAYAEDGDYEVRLTVTDNQGATNSVTHSVTVSATAAQVAFVQASHSAPGATKAKSVTVPAGAKVGDTMVLVFTQGKTASWSGPGAGWTQVSSLDNVSITSRMWVKPVTAADLGSTVSMSLDGYAKAVLSLAVYSGVSTANPVEAAAVVGDSGGTSHATPSLTVGAGDTVVSFWTDKSTAVSQWTAPSGVVERDEAHDNGTSGRFSVLVADSGGPVAAGNYGGLTATTDAGSDKATMWTVALKPGS